MPFQAPVVERLSVRVVVDYLQHTLQELERINLDVVLPMHCTGEAFIAMLRERMPQKVVYSNVGSRFTFGA